ncbi:uncharacterized protein LOC134825901 [Bolinopsis microptera]|uniref:uncharacterized protein LOC134825901 n=1 Tax=Bolinopsis microptera TaxID=2820187 RepID=UPI003078CF3F
MRAIIFLAIVGVAFGNLCKGVNKRDISAAFAAARVGSAAIFGNSCPGFDFDSVALSGECKAIVKQATCYGLKAASHYDSDVVNYGQLASDVSNMEKLGNLACAQARGCFLQVSAAMEACKAANADFVQDTIDAAESAYKENFEDKVAAFAKSSKGSLLGDLASMALDRFSSADDIQDFIEEHLTEGVKSDASAAAEEAQALAKGWCDDGCTSSTARFLEGIFGHMNGGGCDDASEFCGECQSRAASYFARNQLPCCIEKVVQRGIVAYDYVIANYSEALESYGAAVGGGLSASGLAEAQAIRDRVVEEFGCVSAVYSANRPECA